ncbi:hypothetical protein ACIQVR_06740 [Streptomyces xanthochromogenes]|uniref:hypothetical protein n=1 Tax=Streptomyces xanthochromogenes TaxID=67384 RepID=UPI003817B4B9
MEEILQILDGLIQKDQIEEIRARHAAAWPGPHFVEETPYPPEGPGPVVHTDFEIQAVDGSRLAEVSCAHGPTDVDDPMRAVEGARADATFFGSAWADIQMLLTVIDDLRAGRSSK